MQTGTWLPYYVIAGTVFMVVSLGFVFARSATLGRSLWRGLLSVIVLTVWVLIAAKLGMMDVYNGATRAYPTIEFGLGLPIVLFVALSFTPVGRGIVRNLSQTELVSVQVYRVLGGIFLALWAQGQMPALFAWPAGIGDILIGLSAPFVARTGNKGAIRLWNILGLLDLVVAVGTGFMTSPSRFQLFAFDEPNLMITAFPMVLIPTYLVPASILLHLFSLRKLHDGQGS